MQLFLLIVYSISLAALFWVFKDPRAVIVRGKKRSLIVFIALLYAVIAFLPFMEGKSACYHFFVTYPLLYVLILRTFARQFLLSIFNKKFLAVFLFSLLWVQEIPVVMDYMINGTGKFVEGTEIPIVYAGIFSLGKHLIGYAGFYMGMALTIIFFYKRWQYSLRQVFTVGGFWGVLIEQQFLGPVILFSGAFLDFFFFATFVFMTYGLYLAGPYLLFYEEFQHAGQRGKGNPVFLFIAIVIIPLLTWGIWSILLGIFNIGVSGVV